LDNRGELLGRLLGLFCTAAKRDVLLSFEAIVPPSRGLKAEVDLFNRSTFEGDYSIRI